MKSILDFFLKPYFAIGFSGSLRGGEVWQQGTVKAGPDQEGNGVAQRVAIPGRAGMWKTVGGQETIQSSFSYRVTTAVRIRYFVGGRELNEARDHDCDIKPAGTVDDNASFMMRWLDGTSAGKAGGG